METVSSATQGMVRTINVTWADCYRAAEQLWRRIQIDPPAYIYGIPRGGCHAALMVQSLAHRDGQHIMVMDHAVGGALIVDDLVDSGATLQPYVDKGYDVDALFRKSVSPLDLCPASVGVDGWAVFPWELGQDEGTGAEDIVVRLLQFIGEDVRRDGLKDTPKRVLKAWKEITSGYAQDPVKILSTSFDQPHDELVILRGIEFHSTCEHHMLPFYGTATVGYIPGEKVVGISKLARLVDCFARRLQIQERMCSQIAQTILDVLKPAGVGVILKAKHMCMGCRGVLKPDSDMVTSVMLGNLRDNPQARHEFLQLTVL